MEKFQNKYRIGSSRLKNWDYGKNASYFVTICIRNRENLFGKIVDDRLILNELGKIVEEIWLKIPEKFDFAKLGGNKTNDEGVDINDKTDKVDKSTRKRLKEKK